jgi:hypothetical protein
MAIPIKIGPMTFVPKKDYAKRATDRMTAAAQNSLRGATDFELVAADKSGYGVAIKLSEILITEKSLTCNFKGDVADPGGFMFGLNLTGHSATAPTSDEAGDVMAIIDDAIPKMMKVRVLPAVKDAVKTNPGGGAPKHGSPPAGGRR